MRSIEMSARTVEAAVEAACEALGVSRDDLNVSYEVLEFPARKFFKTIPAKVKVTVDGDKISKIEVLSHGETAGVSDPAFETIPDAIIQAQSTDVELASGASYSSQGIIDAVKDALSQAGLSL